MVNLPFYILCVFVAFLPWEMVGELGEFPTVARLIGLLLLITGLFAVASRSRIRRLPLTFGVMVLYLLWSILSISWAIDLPTALPNIVTVVAMLTFVWLIWEFAPTLDRQLCLMQFFVYGLISSVTAQMILFRSMGGGGALQDENMRYAGGGHDTNYYAELLSVGTLFCVILMFHSRGKGGKMLQYWLFLPVLGMSILLTGSRTGFIALVVAGLSILLILRSGGMGKMVMFLVVAGAIAVLGLRLTPEALMTRMTEENGLSEEKLGIRSLIWEAAIKSIQKRPFLGAGSNCVATAIEETGPKRMVSHNLFLTVWVELGVVGLAIQLLLLFLLLREILSMPKTEREIWLAIMLTWGLFIMSSGSPTAKINWFLFAMVLAQAATFRERALAAGAAVGRVLPTTNRPAPRFPPISS